ncbi:MAG: biotin--[acetyl-CoA-carboxylase] ligase [Lachnospiraceae bacterium]
MKKLMAGEEWFTHSRRIVLQEVDSTNEELKRLANKGAGQGTVVIARRQTAGKGRRGRCWHSDSPDSIYMSLLLRPEFSPDKASMITLVAALAVSQSIERVCSLETKIKWPNDILVQEKKVCGILTELYLKEEEIDFLIIGIGINVKQEEFPKELASIATSLEKEAGEAVDREELIHVLLKDFEENYRKFLSCQDLSLLQPEYNKRLISRGRQVQVMGTRQQLSGEAVGINQTGELLVKKSDGLTEAVYAGEVSVRGIYGYV